VRVAGDLVYMFTTMLMAFMGSFFSTAAYAAGVNSVDVLAMLFVMGAAASLLVLLVWYISLLRPQPQQ
jgi:RsiW-degrading membrane proteinase PrsW (M82 family)